MTAGCRPCRRNTANLYWGTDINFDKADVDAATRSLYVRYDDKGGDFTEEIAIYEKAIETEKAKLAAKQNERDTVDNDL